MIEEQHTRFVAAADFTDECTVRVELRRRKVTMTAPQARELAAELIQAATEAERGSADLLREGELAAHDQLVHLSPECEDQFKHRACIGRAWSTAADAEVMCECTCHWDLKKETKA